MDVKCQYFKEGICGSCGLLNVPVASRNTEKLSILATRLAPFCEKQTKAFPFFSPQTVFPSRAKVKLNVSGSIKHPVVGLLDENLEGVSLSECPLHFSGLNQIVSKISSVITSQRLTPYNARNKTGELKGIILVSDQKVSKVILRFVLRSDKLTKRVAKALLGIQKAHPEVRVVSVNYQPIPHAIMEGEQEELLTEQKHIWIPYGDIQVAVGPQCFVQVSPEVAVALYRHVAHLVSDVDSKVDSKINSGGLLDLFCGVGGFSLSCARYVSWSIGVECSQNAVDCAALGSCRNDVSEVQFVCSDVTEYLSNYANEIPNTIIVNPPRRGLEKALCEALIKLKPNYILYSSCNLGTLAMDLTFLSRFYRIISYKPFDMFPLTNHLEIVVQLKLR